MVKVDSFSLAIYPPLSALAMNIKQDVGLGNDMAVCKMSEKYSRNGLKKAHKDIAKRTYYMSEGRVRTVYQYDDPRVTRKATVVYKERVGPSAGGEGGVLKAADDVIEYGDDALQQVRKKGKKEGLSSFSTAGYQPPFFSFSKCRLCKEKKNALRRFVILNWRWPSYQREEHAKNRASRLKDLSMIVFGRSKYTDLKQEADVIIFIVKTDAQLEIILPLYVENRSNNTGKSEDKTGLDDPVNERRVDHLTPFLANVKDPANMTKEEARHVRDNCLKALKER